MEIIQIYIIISLSYIRIETYNALKSFFNVPYYIYKKFHMYVIKLWKSLIYQHFFFYIACKLRFCNIMNSLRVYYVHKMSIVFIGFYTVYYKSYFKLCFTLKINNLMFKNEWIQKLLKQVLSFKDIF